MHHAVTMEQYANAKKIQRTFLGTRSTVLRQKICDVVSIGLINFLAGKEAKLQALLRHLDITAHESLQPLKLLVEFMSFIVGGLMVEAERIEGAVCDTRKLVETLTHEIRRREVELQHRQQYNGTNVTRALAQFYCTKRSVSSASLVSSNEEYLQGPLQAIAEDRVRLQEAKSQLRPLVMVKRLLWGSSNVSQDTLEDALRHTSVSLAIHQFDHKLRDIMFLLKQEARGSLQCLTSLEEFIANVAIGLSAASENLDTCLMSLRKCILVQEEDSKIRCIDARRHERSSVDAFLAFHAPPPVRRVSTSTTETEELSKLYCS